MDADPSLRELAAAVARPDTELDLARAALLIAKGEYPDLDVAAYLARLAELTDGAREETGRGDAVARLHRLREYLFEEQGFRGNTEEYHDPRNSHLNDVLDRRLGIPITLSLVLIEVGRRLAMPLEGIGLPGHFIAGVRIDGEQILLDPFNGGSILTAEACEDLVARALGRRVALRAEHFAPVSKRHLLVRMLCNLKAVYWRREAWAKAVAVIDRLIVLCPGAGAERRDRGVALANMGELERGLADWERYLTDFPAARDYEKVKSQLRRARFKLARLN